MTAPDPKWVEAGARAINGEEATATSGYYGASYRVDSEHAADLAAAVIDAVAPLIREQIAADIERRTEVHAGMDIKCDFCVAFRSAAALARGGAQ